MDLGGGVMKRRSGIAFLSIAVILLVFSTLTAIYIHNLSKDLFKSQSRSIAAKTLQYPKIAIVSMKNWVDKTKPGNGLLAEDIGEIIEEKATPVNNTFFLDIDVPSAQPSLGFFPSLESTRVYSNIRIVIYEATETIGAQTTSLYALIDSTQTNLLAPQATKTIFVYNEDGNLFKEPSDSFEIYTFTATESVIYKFR